MIHEWVKAKSWIKESIAYKHFHIHYERDLGGYNLVNRSMNESKPHHE